MGKRGTPLRFCYLRENGKRGEREKGDALAFLLFGGKAKKGGLQKVESRGGRYFLIRRNYWGFSLRFKKKRALPGGGYPCCLLY